MPKLLTMIAASPAGAAAADGEGPAPEDLLALDAVRATLDATRGDDHEIFEVSSLGDMFRRLRQRTVRAGEELQIVGHGTPGMLALGYFWTGTYRTDTDTFALDSNQFSYNVLDGLIEREATVTILGCAVGADRFGITEADGPTLLFDLARMWSCPVSAPVDLVGPEDFGADGRYARTDLLVTARGREVSSCDRRKDLDTHATGVLPKIAAVQQMRVLGKYETAGRRAKAVDRLRQMGELEVHTLAKPVQSLSLPELVARLDDGGTATFFANARIVRVTRDGHATYYTPAAANDVRDHVRGTVAAALVA